MTTPSPWLTLQEVAERGRCSYETVRRAAVEYQRSNGKSGLKGFQAKPRGRVLVHIEDADRFFRGEKPSRGTRKPAVA